MALLYILLLLLLLLLLLSVVVVVVLKHLHTEMKSQSYVDSLLRLAQE